MNAMDGWRTGGKGLRPHGPLGLLLAVVCLAGAEGADLPATAAGPRGPVGPDAPLTAADTERLARRVAVEGRTAAAVQAACDRAVRQGAPAVFLPAGPYVFDAEVRVPAGLTVFGEGSRTVIRTKDKATHLFSAGGDLVRFTRLSLQGADTSPGTDNESYGISAAGKQNVRIDHCELAGFSYATNFADEAAAQVDHCQIHHNLRDGLGYGVALYSGAYVLVADNEFSQNRHSLASNGALDWSSPKRLGKYVHKPGVRKTHWEFIHNRVGPNDLSPYELCAVDTHPGMDGTFVVEGNLFENLRHGVGIRDGSGLVLGNLFRDLRTKTDFRSRVAVSISYGTHNDVPVEGCMPHDVQVAGNTFVNVKAEERYQVGKAENVTIDGDVVPATRTDRGPPPPMPRLIPMDAEGRLGIGLRPQEPEPPPPAGTQ
jgi:hypothetical protein